MMEENYTVECGGIENPITCCTNNMQNNSMFSSFFSKFWRFMKELPLYSAKAHLIIIGIMIIQLTPVPYTLVATPEKNNWTNMTT